MLNKFVKMHLKQSCGFFAAAYAAGSMGMLWLGMTLTGSRPIAPFAFAPSIVFLTVSLLVWIKALDVVMNRSLRAPESFLMMSLPVSEEVLVGSKVFTSSLGSVLLYFLIGSLAMYDVALDHGLEFRMTSLSAVFIDLSYPAWLAAVSIGLVPILILLEQAAFSSLLLCITLLTGNHRKIQKCTCFIYLIVIILQIGFNAWLIINYETFIGRMHPLVLELGLAVIFGVITTLLFKTCVHCLRYKYAV